MAVQTETPAEAVPPHRRGDGSADRMKIAVITPDGQYSITLRFDGTDDWKREIHRSGWSRPGTPPLNWSKITRIYVNGRGTRSVDVEKITLIGGVKSIHLEESRPLGGVVRAGLGVPFTYPARFL